MAGQQKDLTILIKATTVLDNFLMLYQFIPLKN